MAALFLCRKMIVMAYFAVMEERVEIPVEFEGNEWVYQARVQTWKYGMRFLVDLDGVEVIFERDDAGVFRAVLPQGFEGRVPDKGKIVAIAGVLESL